jgi:Uma2 family endonuclease
MVQPLPPRLTEAQYLALERVSEEKHEFVDGLMIPVHDPTLGMAGATPEHNAIVGNVVTALNNGLRTSPCRVFPSDLKVRAARSRYYYPDVTVACKPVYENDVLLNPTVIVEVISESTERRDRGEKSRAYRTLHSCTDYLLCSSTEPLVEHHIREADGSWRLREYGPGEVVPLRGVGVSLAVDDLYRKVFGES